MKINKIVDISSKFIDCFAYKSAVYYLLSKKDTIEIAVFDVRSFEPIHNFLTFYSPNLFVVPAIDEEYIYLPSTDGRLIGIDRTSGKMKVNIDLGLMTVVSEPAIDGEYIYSVCGVPISHGIKTDTKHFVICKNDKKTGKKLAQSRLMPGPYSQLSLSEKSIYCFFDSYLSMFGEQHCDLAKQYKMKFQPSYKPIVHPHAMVISSNSGYLALLDKNYKVYFDGRTDINKTMPYLIDDHIYWFVNNKICTLNIDDPYVWDIGMVDGACTGVCRYGNRLFATGDQGQVVELDVYSHSTNAIKISDDTLYDPYAFGDYLVVHDRKRLFHILIK